MSDELFTVESKLLCRAIREACWYLGRGSYAAGYRCLYLGLTRVCEDAEADAAAQDLARSYRTALFHYAQLSAETPPRRTVHRV